MAGKRPASTQVHAPEKSKDVLPFPYSYPEHVGLTRVKTGGEVGSYLTPNLPFGKW